MTPEELNAAQARLTEVDTEVAALVQTEREYIQKAREFNLARRQVEGKRVELENSSRPLREAVAQGILEARQRHAEQALAQAKAKERQALEQAKSKELSELEKLRLENERLTNLLAKG